jgi:prolyl oligopeptidase
MSPKYTYTQFERLPLRENLHGKAVSDPYRWLEDPKSDGTKKFVAEQNKITDTYLASYKEKDKLFGALCNNWNYEKFGVPTREGSSYFYFHNSGLQQQNVLYQVAHPSSTDAKVFFDPNVLSKDGTVALQTYSFSENAQYFAYALSESGSDWSTIYVKNVETGETLSDKIEWVKFSGISWTKDEQGFFYCRYPKPDIQDGAAGTETQANRDAFLCYHTLNSKQEDDIVVYKNPEAPLERFGASVSDDGAYLLMTSRQSTAPVNKIFIANLENRAFPSGQVQWNKLVDDFDAGYSYITNQGSTLYFLTNKDSPNYKVVKYDLNNHNQGFVDVVPESSNVIEDATCINQSQLLLHYLEDVKSVLQIHELSQGTMLKRLQLPVGSIVSIASKKEDSEFFFKFTSFIDPGTTYRFNAALLDQEPQVYRQTKLSSMINPKDFVTNQLWFESKDGTEIPMFVVHHKDLVKTGDNPTLLYGYGGFSISILPSFSPARLTFLHHYKGVLAVANLRGGAEFGEKWHKAGCLKNKQNVFDDFQFAAKKLIEDKYSNPQKICIQGGSNGGLLVGACVNQAPELFGCALAHVGVMDMIRFHKFTIGYAWKADYGDPEVKEDFEVQIKYSPLHNIGMECNVSTWTEEPSPPSKKDLSKYPAVLVLTSDHDDRVVPLHSFKYIATLQHEAGYTSERPFLARIETNAGHGAGKPTMKIIEETRDFMSFMALNLNCVWHD